MTSTTAPTTPVAPTSLDEGSTGTEALTTGWEPDVDVSDSMLRRYLFHNADLTAAIAEAAGGRVLRRPDVVAADLGRPSGYWNAATLLAPPADLAGTLDDLAAFYRGGRGEAVLWCAWPTGDLRPHGWRLSGHPPLLVRPPASLVPAEVPTTGIEGVERVVEPEALARWERTAIEGYPMPELASEPPGSVAPPALLDDPRFGFWAAPGASDPGAIAMGFRSRGLGSLALGVSRPERRHHGLWQQLCAARLRWFADDWAAGVFSDFSRRGAERLGFVPLTRLTLWILDRP